MKVEFPDARPLTPEEQDEYNRLKTIIERAITDKVNQGLLIAERFGELG